MIDNDKRVSQLYFSVNARNKEISYEQFLEMENDEELQILNIKQIYSLRISV